MVKKSFVEQCNNSIGMLVVANGVEYGMIYGDKHEFTEKEFLKLVYSLKRKLTKAGIYKGSDVGEYTLDTLRKAFKDLVYCDTCSSVLSPGFHHLVIGPDERISLIQCDSCMRGST